MIIGAGAVPYTFQNYDASSGVPQPILGDQLNANFAAVVVSAGTFDMAITGSVGLLVSQIEYTGFNFSGPLLANATVTWPADSQGFAVITNATTGGFSIICGMSGGAFATIASGVSALVWSNGVTFVQFATAG